MSTDRHLDSELYLPSCDHARFSWSGGCMGKLNKTLDRVSEFPQENPPMPSTAGVGLLVASTLLAGSGKVPDYCEEELLRGSSRSPQAYKFHDSRCEGEYAQHVSATGLNLRSLTLDLGSFDPSEGLDLTWKVPPGVGADAVRILALSLRSRLYFRMDTEVPVKNGSFHWPGDVLESFELSSEEIGIRAWVTLSGPGGTTRDVHLPVGRRGAASASKDGYQICLWPNASLKEVRLSVAQIDAQGNPTKWLRQNEDADLGDFIPSDEAACLTSGPLGPPGYYRVKLSATARKGGLAVEEFDLYHP